MKCRAGAGATALLVAGFGAVGYGTRQDLSGPSRILTWALVALIAFGFITVLVHVPNGSLIYAVLGLLVFAGLTAYDFQRLRRPRTSAARRCSPPRSSSMF